MDTELVTYKRKECANEYVRSNQHDSNYFWDHVWNWLFELLYDSSLYPWYVIILFRL